jgi:hypothetical protein
MAEVAAQKLAVSLKEVRAALAAPEHVRKDKMFDAFCDFDRAIGLCARGNAEALDRAVTGVEEKANIFAYLLTCGEKEFRRNKLLQCLKYLLSRPAWLQAASRNDELKKQLKDFLEGCPVDTADLKKYLDSPPELTEPESGEVEIEKRRRDPDEHATEEEKTTAGFLSSGLSKIKAVEYRYPTGPNTADKSDKAMAGFHEFFLGVERIAFKITHAADSKAKLTRLVYKDMLAQYDDQFPKLLDFIVAVHGARTRLHGQQCVCMVNTLSELSVAFKKCMEEKAELPVAFNPCRAG